MVVPVALAHAREVPLVARREHLRSQVSSKQMGITRYVASTYLLVVLTYLLVVLTYLLVVLTYLDERRVVSAEAAAGGGQALHVEAGDGARQAIVLEEQIVDQVAQLARVALECADVDARLGVEAARRVLQRLGLGSG